MFGKAWKLGKDSVTSFINDGALSRGAAIAFYTVTSIGPVLLIVVAIAGLAFSQDAARGAIVSQLSGLMGQESAELLQNVIRSASGKPSGIFASARQGDPAQAANASAAPPAKKVNHEMAPERFS
jgi:membrane protein